MQNALTAPSLCAAYLDQFKIGAAVRLDQLLDADRAQLIKRHFNSLTAENDMKPERLLDHAATLACGDAVTAKCDFSTCDRYLAFARENGLQLRFHVLCWHNQTPRWFFAKDWVDAPDAPLAGAALMQKRLESYIQTVMEHVNRCYPGVVYAFDVVNEAIEPAQGAVNALRSKSPWYEAMGGEFIPCAFRAARRFAAPGQKLFYNDYNCFEPEKCEAICGLLSRLKAEGIVDGMGMQAHFVLDGFDAAACERAARAYADLGLTLHATELDIHCTSMDEESQERLASAYESYFAMLLKLKREGVKVENVTFWGLTDADSWLTGFRKQQSYPLLFTGDRRTKLAFDRVLNAPSH
ncbi:MAG: endo-1,4-beta-xylanase [Clostridia bacterium]|nr:endo-1,4-beta-xylanase [Clostridia bacterium]